MDDCIDLFTKAIYNFIFLGMPLEIQQPSINNLTILFSFYASNLSVILNVLYNNEK